MPLVRLNGNTVTHSGCGCSLRTASWLATLVPRSPEPSRSSAVDGVTLLPLVSKYFGRPRIVEPPFPGVQGEIVRSCIRLYSQCSWARVFRKSSSGVASSIALATVALTGLRSICHVDEGVVEFFVVSEYLSTSERLAATLSVTAGCCGANLRVRTMVAHDERLFPPTSQTESDERGKVEVGFGICCASSMLGA